MILVLERGCPPEQIAEAVAELEKLGLQVRRLHAGGKPVLHVAGGDSSRARRVLRVLEQVEGLVATSGPRVRREGRPFFPYHFIQWSAVGIVLLAVLTLLAGQFPPGIGAPIDVQHPPGDVFQPWYLRAPAAFLETFPASLAWVVALAAAALFLLMPWFDRSPGPGLRGRWLPLALGFTALAAVLVPLLREVLR